MEEEVEAFIKQCHETKLPVLISKVNSKILDILATKMDKGNKVTGPVYSAVRKLLEFIGQKSQELTEEVTILKTQIEERKKHEVVLQELAERISRGSTGTQVDAPVGQPDRPVAKRDEHTVVVTMGNTDVDPADVKRKIKDLCKSNDEVPVPTDVIVTKTNRVILKMAGREDTEKMRKAIVNDSDMKSSIKVNVTKKRRERLLILSVDQEVEQEIIEKALRKILSNAEEEEDRFANDLKRKLIDPSLDEGAKMIVRELLSKTMIEFNIIRKIKTRQDKMNWLIDVDSRGKEILLDQRKICIDFERYRVVEHVSITRCFRCQKYGHYAGQCTGVTHCVRCADEHDEKDCKSVEIRCANCYFENQEGDCNHRSDSPDCPAFQKYRMSLLAKRS